MTPAFSILQGTHSVGVQRQYTGSAGKIANRQIGVVPRSRRVPSKSPWTSSCTCPPLGSKTQGAGSKRVFPTRRDGSNPKVQLALDMIGRAKVNGIPGDILLADSAYGDSTDFRNAVRKLGFDFAVGVLPTLGVVRLDRPIEVNAKRESVA